MKLKVYFKPAIPVGLLAAAACFFSVAFVILGSGVIALAAFALALFYTTLAAMSILALLRLAVLERWQDWQGPARLLILAPHEDDCVISAGGVGAHNSRIGGTTRIVYLAPDEAPGMAERRAGEAREAWRVAGVIGDDVRHVDLLPPLRQRDPQKLRAASGKLRSIIDEFGPTVVVVPMFEGGHVHHDMLAALLGTILTDDDRFEVFEAPEYSPYASLWYTPHRVIALCSRWLFGLVSYYGPPDGIDCRPVAKYRLDPDDLERKRRMLAAFESQNAPSLVVTRSYPDRLVSFDRNAKRSVPFDFRWSYLRFVLAMRRLLPTRLVDRLLPVQLGTVGRECSLTDWREEWTRDP
ncbi:N-acetylglucosaminyl deacetylase, LmbE family [Rhodospirillales bacterium URHD0017]|nr:N-acetylglucosaminyl deacetylase, LmbE family [Rhodospirillales bacterium URHD0017]